jgi:hypothetical protein
MQHRLSLEEMLQLIADGAARVLTVPRVSVRLLDTSRAQLVAVARAGAPFHDKPVQFGSRSTGSRLGSPAPKPIRGSHSATGCPAPSARSWGSR